MVIKAAVCRRYGDPLLIEDLSLDEPGPGEVLVRVGATAICHSDLHFVAGAWVTDNSKLPAVAGHETAGFVEALGPGVDDLAPGQKVIASLLRSCGRCSNCQRGRPSLCSTEFALTNTTRLHDSGGHDIRQGINVAGFAEYVVVHRSQLVAIPADLPVADASLLACGVITGVGAVLNTAQVPAGSSVAVIGIGGVGLNALQGARLAAAAQVIAVDLRADKLEFGIQFGASHTVRVDDAETATQRIRELTDGKGVDFAIVTVGSSAAVDLATNIVARPGTIVLVGLPSLEDRLSLSVRDVVVGSVALLGSFMGDTRLSVDVPRLVQLYQQGNLQLGELISERFALADINAALEATASGAAKRNVIVFD
jgi:S-(hydroxymethyl)glutathione dehydrogenase/alcohol dehydrogenase